jgi:exportin-7
MRDYGRLCAQKEFNLVTTVGTDSVYCSITNLKCLPAHERIVDDSLTLLNDLSVGYTSVRKLIKLDEVQYLLNNHTVCCQTAT